MKVDKEQIERGVVIAICLVWIGALAYNTYFVAKPYSYSEQRFQNQLNDCEGNFSQRYECKSSMIDERNASKFSSMLKDMSIILGPAIVLYGGWAFLAARRKQKADQELSKKRRAVMAENKRAEEDRAKRIRKEAEERRASKEEHDAAGVVGGATQASIDAEFAAMEAEANGDKKEEN